MSAGLRSGRAYGETLSVPGILVIDQRPVQQVVFMFIVNKLEAFQIYGFIIFSRFIQNHSQGRPCSAVALLRQPDGFGIKPVQHFEKFVLCRFRDRYFNHKVSSIPALWVEYMSVFEKSKRVR